MTDQVYKRAVNLLEADIGDELVALNVKKGECFGFNEVATSVWRSLAEPKGFEQLLTELLANYDVGEEQCLAELRELLEDMRTKGLIE